MSDRAKYSRVYWRILQDEEFDTIRANESRVGAWVLMLLAAEMSWPAPAYIPPVVSKKSLFALAEAGLVELLDGGRFTLRGLDKERERRKIAATRDPSGSQPGPQQGPNWDPDGRVAKQSIDKKSKDEHTERDSLDTYHELTGWRPWGIWSGDQIRGAQTEYTDAKVDAALRAEYAEKPDRDSLLRRTLARLARDAERSRQEAKDRPRPKRPPEDRAAVNAELKRLMVVKVEDQPA